MNNEFFRLNESSFHILKANYESSRAGISDLVDDAEFDEFFEVEEVHRAQQSLVTPKMRLMEELSWLPELSDVQVAEVISLIEVVAQLEPTQFKPTDLKSIVKVIAPFPELAKANILAHLCGVQRADQALIQSLATSWAEIDPPHLLGFINDTRVESGFPRVDEQQLRQALREVEGKHSNVAAASIWKNATPGILMDKIVVAELDNNPSGVFLGLLVRSYDSRSETDLVRINGNINDHIELAKPNGADLGEHVGAISDLLDAWDEINQPVQVFEQHQGHEEGRSKRVYENVRALCLDLANNHEEYREARRLSEALLRTFPELESVAEVLKNDVAQLGTLDEQQRQTEFLAPLAEACEAAKKDRKLNNSLARRGFAANRRGGVLSRLVKSFEHAVSNMTDTSYAFFLVRDLALYINNDLDDPETAFRLVDGLMSHNGAVPSDKVCEKMEEDRAIIHRNWKMRELDENAGNLSAMSQTVDEMLEYARGPDRIEILQLKEKIDSKRRQKWIKRGIYAAIAAVIGFFVLAGEFNRPSSRSNYQPTTNRTTSSSPTVQTTTTRLNRFEEDKPSIGNGKTLTRSEVRYCTFQGERLDFMRSLSMTNSQINRFNQLIGDYNLRCSNFRYRAGVLTTIQSEAAARTSILRADARRMVSSW